MSRSPARGHTDLPPAARGETPWHDLECGSYVADLALWRKLAAAAARKGGAHATVLEIGCGTGRVTLALAAAGCQVTGIDTDRELVAALQGRARERDAEVEAFVADARTFDLGRRFDLVLAPMQLVQLLRSQAARARMLRRIAAHLEPHGLAGFAMLAPSFELFDEDSAPLLPDIREIGGWVFSSQPVAIRSLHGGAAIELERRRQAVSPRGEIVESTSRVVLAAFTAEALEQEAVEAGLVPHERREIAATRDHVASSVVIARRA